MRAAATPCSGLPRGASRRCNGTARRVTRLPAGAAALARSPVCPNQAFRVGDSAFGIQYHVELTGATVHEWGDIPEYAASLERTLGAGGLERMQAGAAAHMHEFNDNARRLYDAFAAVARERSPVCG